MSDTYSVTVKMEKDTADRLLAEGKKLYVFRAVKGPSDGKPLVWMNPILTEEGSNISWTVNYGAYFSYLDFSTTKTYITNGKVALDLGEEAVINEKGIISKKGGEVSDSIVILDSYDQTPNLTCGIGDYKDEAKTKFNPMCAFSIDYGDSSIITPLQKIALMFAKETIKTATVVERSIGPGILVDVTNNHDRVVEYDMTKFWTADLGGLGATTFAADSEMNPLLITPEPNSGKLSKKIPVR